MAILTHASQMLCAQKLASNIVITLVGQAFMHFNMRFTSVKKQQKKTSMFTLDCTKIQGTQYVLKQEEKLAN